MLGKLLNKISGDYNANQIKKTQPLIDEANQYFEKYKNFSHDQFVEKTNQMKQAYQDGTSLDTLLPEAFGTLKAAAYSLKGQTYQVKGYEYTWNMVPFDVQMLGGAILHSGKIAEMKTGEGKTLVATLPAYLNALSGKGVHIVTVNDYLVSFGAEQMSFLFNHLGISVGAVTKFTPIEARRKEYEKDIVYVENTEIGFDYLRDNLAKSLEERVLVWRPLNYAIVDEVDSVLIDEARTPLIISQPSQEATEKYVYYARIVQSLIPSKNKKKVSKGFLADMLADEKNPRENQGDDGDYYIDEKLKTAILSSKGIEKLEKMLGVENLYKDFGFDEIHHIENALKALSVYHLDKDYIIQNGEILIVDEHTGRTMPGRRFSEGLHQAIEAKENVVIQRESKTLATITYQNFFKIYNKISGMTGTASTEGEEFEKMYKLETVVIPTNKPTIRVDKNDSVYVNEKIKWKFVTDAIDFYHQMGVPLLIGTSSISTSEHVSSLLREYAIPHYVLNAKYHEQEAQIVASGGNFGSVIVATNMAGRGTDIKLQDGLNQKIAQNYANYAKKMVERLGKLTFNIFTPIELNYTLNGLFETGLIDEKDFSSLQHGKSTQNISLIFGTKNNNKKSKGPSVYASLVFKGQKQGGNDLTKDIHYGLGVIGTEKHDARRIDNQLRGRSGRQGDAGFSKFYVALDDTIMKKMGGDQIQKVAMAMSGLLGAKDEINSLELNQPQFTSSIERSQRQLEGWYFSIRKNLFDYDSVIAKQRERIYAKRDEIIFGADKDENWIFDEIKKFISQFVYENGENFRGAPEEFSALIKETFDVDYSGSLHQKDLKHLVETLDKKFEEKISSIENKNMLGDVLKRTYLGIIDKNWIDNIDDMQYLREKVSMYGYAQQEPLLIYKQQAFEKFNSLLGSIKKEILYGVFNTNFDYIDNQNQIIQLVDGNEENVIDRLQDASAGLKADEIQQAQNILETFSGNSQYGPQLEQQAKESYPSYKEGEYEVIEVEDKK